MSEEMEILKERLSQARADLDRVHRPGAVPADEITALSLRGLLALAVGMAEQIIEQESGDGR